MHRGAACKIETPHLVDPTIRIPSPACDRVVNEGCPYKYKNHAWEHSTALRSSADSQGGSNGSKHALKDRVREIADIHSGLSEDAFEAKVLKITDKLARRMRKR
jgi:hypothetical protein